MKFRQLAIPCADDTAMVFAEQKMIPRVFAAVVRAVTAARTLGACLTPAWAKAQRAKSLSPFQSLLLKKAGTVIASPLDAARAVDRLLPACGAHTATCTVSP